METKGYIYYDDSKHSSSDFYLGAFVYSKTDLNKEISIIISECGLNPNKDEFKSRIRMDQNPKNKKLRACFEKIIFSKKIAIVISPPNEKDFEDATINAIIELINNNIKDLLFPLNIFLDQGIIKNIKSDKYISLLDYLTSMNVSLHIEQDSKLIKGIQFADFIAHSCSIMLKEELGSIKKTVKSGEKLGYESDMDIEIGFELWFLVRYRFFSSPPPHPSTWKNQLDFEAKVYGKGLFISPNCSSLVKEKSLKRFGKIYLGCIW